MTSVAIEAFPIALGIVVGVLILVLILWKLGERKRNFVYNFITYAFSIASFFVGIQSTKFADALQAFTLGALSLIASIYMTVELIKEQS